jgi:NADH-quinone oxidoreductase subunit M
MQIFSHYFIIFTLANISLPGTFNFVGELLIFIGIFYKNSTIALFAGLGVVLSAAYSI